LSAFQPYLDFELGTELTSVFLGHVLDRFSGLDLTIPLVQFSGPTSREGLDEIELATQVNCMRPTGGGVSFSLGAMIRDLPQA
jgi:hypothetical protein